MASVQVVVAALSMAVAEGEVVALIGHFGCGKTTPLNCIAGLLAPTRVVLASDPAYLATRTEVLAFLHRGAQ